MNKGNGGSALLGTQKDFTNTLRIYIKKDSMPFRASAKVNIALSLVLVHEVAHAKHNLDISAMCNKFRW